MVDENRKKFIAKKIGDKIYNLRKSKNLSREKFAEMCDLSAQYVYYMEKGEFMPGCLTIIDICNNFPITPSELLMDSLDLDFTLFDESIKNDFSKLPDKDKKFLQELIKDTIKLLMEKNEGNF